MHSTVARSLAVALPAIMIVCIVLYSLTAAPTAEKTYYAFVALAHFLLLSGASLIVGGFFGFLFAMPPNVGDRRVNGRAPFTTTNLEQASDWLIKLLLGAGLTQIKEILAALSSLVVTIATILTEQGTLTTLGKPTFFLGTLMVFFGVYGFILAYFLFRRRDGKNGELAGGPGTGKKQVV